MKPRSQAGPSSAPEERREKRERGSKAKQIESVKIPVDTVNEVVLHAAAMVLLGRDPAAAKQLLGSVPADSLYGKGHAESWTVLQEMARRGLSYDPATARQISGGAVDTDTLDGYLQLRPEPPPNLKHHVDMVRWDRARVECTRGPLSVFMDALKDPTSDPGKVRALAKMVSASFDGHGDRRFLRDPTNIVRSHSATLTARRNGHAIYPLGIPALDDYTEGDEKERKVDGVTRMESLTGTPRLVPGLRPGDITTMLAVTGGGKTTTTAFMVLQQAKQYKRKVLYGAWEQGSELTLELLAGISLGWSRTDISTGNFTEEDQAELEEEMESLGEYIRFFELPFGRKRGEKERNDKNLDLIQEVIQDACCDVFVADLMKLAMPDSGYGDEDNALYRMKSMMEEERCHGVLLHQLKTKDLEAREDKRPTRDAVKGNSAWLEVSSTMIGWHMPALFKSVPNDKIEAIVLKQRYGHWPQAVELDWDPEYGHIGEGRTIHYDRPGEQEQDGGDILTPPKRNKFARGKKAR